ncbi:MAG: DUF899 family protein [Gemmatimonadaceae bacterium]|nr:DUF899 family protein [Gemmatimonadaceae bacterium]
MNPTFPNESPEYRAARNLLLTLEIELRRATEAVAVARRALPPGGLLKEDYVFHGAVPDGSPHSIRLSNLFAPGKRSLVIYNMMFPRHPTDARPPATKGSTARLPVLEGPCPSCAALLDQLDGAAGYVDQQTNFVVIAKAPLPRLLAFAKDRGWRRLRLLSSAGNTFKRDYGGEAPDGSQLPMLNVFERSGDEIRHFWSAEMLHAQGDPGQDPRHVGLLEPLWNLFDMTRHGRPSSWQEQLG